MVSAADMERYLGEVQALVIEVQASCTGLDVASASHLIDHGEPAEGLRSLAWEVVEGGHRLNANHYERLLRLTEGLVAPSDLPPTLAEHVG